MAELLQDPQMQRFMQVEGQRQKFQGLVQTLTGQCWDTCMGYPGPRMDRKTETCFVNCVERFLDTSNFVVNKLEKEGQAQLAQSEGSSSEGFKWQ